MEAEKAHVCKFIHQFCPKLIVDWLVSSVIYKLANLSTNIDHLANKLTSWQITYFPGGL